ncbi:hypothetical protein [Ectopseudomonas toyotomiensis]|uniref:hypothetical protein n=1 Tax=Ectopseudomonas toyotomiensis TaxID=554344 RepID=UPI003D0BC466
MPSSTNTCKVSLPRIKKIKLESFDLYTHKPNSEISIDKSVFCLMGANGLGKSTFLNTVNYAITGAIPDPTRKFITAQEYYKDAARGDRALDYFSGRIKEESRDAAQVTATLEWPTHSLEVTRRIFSSQTVCMLQITNLSTGSTETLSRETGHNEEHLTRLYESEALRLSRLEKFPQFAFIFHFVMTFDEGRHLLLWDDDALTNALYLAFGTDPLAVRAVEKLTREMNRESSRGRNVRFSATHVANRIKQLLEALGSDNSADFLSQDEVQVKHDLLLSRHKEREGYLSRKQSELRDTDLKWTDLSAKLTELTIEYDKVFSERIQKSTTVDHHPLIRSTISTNTCGVCGSSNAAEIVLRMLEEHQCPLCNCPTSELPAGSDTTSALKELDSQILKTREDLTSILKTRERLTSEVESAELDEHTAFNELRAFETEESVRLASIDLGANHSGIKQQIEKLEREREEFIKQSKAHYKKRDEIRDQLRFYEHQLKSQYDTGSEIFVPRFRELAQEFIGLPIDIELEHRHGANSSGFGLRLRMKDQLRTTPDKLSESQRFFLDIALRMALSEFMSDSGSTLIIDTPEGSLDIAYEARAGAMLAKFAADKNAIIMTANLRSSELVQRLALLRKSAGMQVVRMTDWTELSQVQKNEEALFLKAYDAIDTALS